MVPKQAEVQTKKMVGLPFVLATPTDLGRLIREMDSLDELIMQSELRQKDHPVKLPHTSLLMEKTLEINKVNLLDKEERKMLKEFLNNTKAKAPVLHISFSADPSPAFMVKLITWLRQEIHPFVLVTIGLQHNLGAGCIVRSTNKYFDMSLRQDFAKKRELLMQSIAERVATPQPQGAAT